MKKKLLFLVISSLMLSGQASAEEISTSQKLNAVVSVTGKYFGKVDEITIENQLFELNKSIAKLEEVKQLAKNSLQWAEVSGNTDDLIASTALFNDLDKTLKLAVSDSNKMNTMGEAITKYNDEINNAVSVVSKNADELFKNGDALNAPVLEGFNKSFTQGLSKNASNALDDVTTSVSRNVSKVGHTDGYKSFKMGKNGKTSLNSSGKITKGLQVVGTGIGLYNAYGDYKKDIDKYGDDYQTTARNLVLVQGAGEIINNVNPFAIVGVLDLAVGECSDTDTACNIQKAIIGSVSNPIGQTVATSRQLVDALNVTVDALERGVESDQMTYDAIDRFMKQGAFGIPNNKRDLLLNSSSVEEFEFNAELAANALESNADHWIRFTENSIKYTQQDIEDIQNELNSMWSYTNIFRGFEEIELHNQEAHENILLMKLEMLKKFKATIRDEKGNINPEILAQFSNGWVLHQTIKANTDYLTAANKVAKALESANDELQNKVHNLQVFEQEVLDLQKDMEEDKEEPSLDHQYTHDLMCTATSYQTSAIGGCASIMTNKTGEQVQDTSSTQADNTKIVANDTTQLITAHEQSTTVQDVTIAAGSWTVVEGDTSKHLRIGDSFGSITAPNSGQIAALNNADMSQTVMERTYTVPNGVRNVNTSMLANFVTNEYPEYVGTKFNDAVKVEVMTGSGNSYNIDTAFSQELNNANLSAVSGLPTPMDSTGGQTGFMPVEVNNIPVAGGGEIKIRVTSDNVGDDLYPSAVLINDSQVGSQ